MSAPISVVTPTTAAVATTVDAGPPLGPTGGIGVAGTVFIVALSVLVALTLWFVVVVVRRPAPSQHAPAGDGRPDGDGGPRPGAAGPAPGH